MGAPAAVEPRVACPACGGLVHPIAGRCKHCKADLTRLRGAPSGSAPRPALVALGGGATPAPAAAAGANGHPAPAHAVHPVHPVQTEPVPGRTTASPARWPLLVAAIAVVAIVASLALLVFGDDDGKKTSRARRFEGPAPELTPTDPLAPQMTPPRGGVPTPSVPSGPDPDPTPTPTPAPPPPSGPGPGARGPSTVTEFFGQAVERGCRRMSTCAADDPAVTAYCDSVRQAVDWPTANGTFDQLCPDYDAGAAAQCLAAIDRFPCPSGRLDVAQAATTLMALSGCQEVCKSTFGSGALPLSP